MWSEKSGSQVSVHSTWREPGITRYIILKRTRHGCIANHFSLLPQIKIVIWLWNMIVPFLVHGIVASNRKSYERGVRNTWLKNSYIFEIWRIFSIGRGHWTHLFMRKTCDLIVHKTLPTWDSFDSSLFEIRYYPQNPVFGDLRQNLVFSHKISK